METKYKHTSELLKEKTNPIIEIFFDFAQLKNLYHQGWLDFGVSKEHAETVADHSFGLAMIAYTIAIEYRPDLDPLKVLQLAVFHDLGEIFVGDLTPRDNVSREEKRKRETEAVQKVFSKLPNGQKYIRAWLDYEDRELPEAKFVEQVDKLELALQASVYERIGYNNLQEFFTYYNNRIIDPKLQEILKEIISIRTHENRN